MKYDLHIHTYNSACSNLKPSLILKVAKRMGLNGVAICDHNTIKGGVEVSKLNKDRDFEVVKGIEVNTDRGHVLGLYINQGIRSREFFDVVDNIKRQGGIAIIAHPFRLFPKLRSDLKGIDIKRCLDAVECYNARTSYFGNRSALKLAEQFKMAKTGGSDAHFSFEIGRCVTQFEDGLVSAIKRNKTKVAGSNVPGLLGSTFSFVNKNIFRRWG